MSPTAKNNSSYFGRFNTYPYSFDSFSTSESAGLYSYSFVKTFFTVCFFFSRKPETNMDALLSKL